MIEIMSYSLLSISLLFSFCVFQINELMILLSTKKNAASLKLKGCPLRPVKLFVVKWSGIFNMLQRYIAIRPYLNAGGWIPNLPVVNLIPSAADHASILEIFHELKKFQELSLVLQKANGSLSEARSGLNWLIEKFPVTNIKLGPNFCHPRHRAFESGVTKVQGNKEADLTPAEKVALEPLLKEDHVEDATPGQRSIPRT